MEKAEYENGLAKKGKKERKLWKRNEISVKNMYQGGKIVKKNKKERPSTLILKKYFSSTHLLTHTLTNVSMINMFIV